MPASSKNSCWRPLLTLFLCMLAASKINPLTSTSTGTRNSCDGECREPEPHPQRMHQQNNPRQRTTQRCLSSAYSLPLSTGQDHTQKSAQRFWQADQHMMRSRPGYHSPQHNDPATWEDLRGHAQSPAVRTSDICPQEAPDGPAEQPGGAERTGLFHLFRTRKNQASLP